VLLSQKVFPGCRSRYERLVEKNGAFASLGHTITQAQLLHLSVDSIPRVVRGSGSTPDKFFHEKAGIGQGYFYFLLILFPP
jgi:hypothetical protein